MSVLIEKSRNELVAKSKRDPKGLQRYKRRVKSRISTNTSNYNRLDMTSLFKDDILNILIEVVGETDKYTVKLSFGGFIEALAQKLKQNQSLDLRLIITSLINAFNTNDVYVHCNCPDATYRMDYWQTISKTNSGQPQLIKSEITNPDDKLGSACKHVLLVLANTSWIIKVASVINNYIKWMQKNRKTQYDSIIYPALYGKKKPVQLSIIDNEDEVTDNSQVINKQGSLLGRGRKTNSSQQNTNQNKIQAPLINKNQQSLFNDEEIESDKSKI